MPDIPRIMGGAEQPVFRACAAAQLRTVGLAEDHQAGGTRALDVRIIYFAAGVAEEHRAFGGDGIGHRYPHVFQKEGHTAKGPVGYTVADRLPGKVVVFEDYRIQRRIDLFGTRNGQLQQFGGAHLAGANQLSQGGGIELAVLLKTEPRGARRRGGAQAEGQPASEYYAVGHERSAARGHR
ncbi:hypothetical protein D3C81_1373950 [compost metagenome]